MNGAKVDDGESWLVTCSDVGVLSPLFLLASQSKKTSITGKSRRLCAQKEGGEQRVGAKNPELAVAAVLFSRVTTQQVERRSGTIDGGKHSLLLNTQEKRSCCRKAQTTN